MKNAQNCQIYVPSSHRPRSSMASTKYKNRFLYFGSVCIVKSWYKLEEDGLEGLNGVDKAQRIDWLKLVYDRIFFSFMYVTETNTKNCKI